MGSLREFVADVLESEGAAVEPIEPDELEVLAPEPLCRAMGWPELVRLGFGPTPSAGVAPIRLEGDWLDRFGALIGDRGRFAERQLALPREIAPPGTPERLIERAIELPNAVWRLRDTKPAWARCFLPGITMLGLSRIDSIGTRCRASSANTARSVRSVASWQTSSECAPSISTSGSTIGTRSCSIAIAA